MRAWPQLRNLAKPSSSPRVTIEIIGGIGNPTGFCATHSRGALLSSAALIGQTLNRKYELVRLLGEGGMGAVYEARATGTQERVAVKVMNSRLLELGGDGIHRFRREARAASAVDSKHIVRVIEFGDDEATGLLYLVMEHLEGEDLQHLVDRRGPLVPDAALRVAAQALIGLQKAHEARIIHRDIKPANLFLARGPDGEITVKLLDFGIAKIKADPLGAVHTTGLTNTGGILGSPLYSGRVRRWRGPGFE